MDTDEKPKEPTVVEVELNGKKYSLDRAMAAELEAERKKLNTQLEETRKELRLARTTATPKEPPKADDDDADLVFTDPKAYKERIKEEVRAEYRADQQRQSNEQEFWKGFYRINDDLDAENQWLYTQVIQEQYNELLDSGKSKAEIYHAIGEEARARILKLAGKKTGKGGSAVVEGAGNLKASEEEEVEKPTDKKADVTSIGDIVKARRAARAKAIQGRQSA